MTCDVTDPDSVDHLIAEIASAHGRLDVVFNNAGTNVPAMPIDELTVEQWRQVIDVNLRSVPYTVSKHAISGLTNTLALDGRPFNIACGQIDIGNAASAMTERMSGGVPQADGSIKPEPTMDTQHIADAIVQMASLPLSANVLSTTIMATNMPFVGRG